MKKLAPCLQEGHVRKYLAERAELLGAVRLPNTAFRANAGTEVTSDIIFLQKRDRMVKEIPDWVHTSEDEQGIRMNSYFAEHPEQIVGHMEMVSGPHGMESACIADTDRPFKEQLNEALANIKGRKQVEPLEDEILTEDKEDEILTNIVVKEAVQCLTMEEQELLLLRYVNEVPVSDICSILKISRFSLYRKNMKILRKLKNILGEEDFT